jgi:hypothetical protein
MTKVVSSSIPHAKMVIEENNKTCIKLFVTGTEIIAISLDKAINNNKDKNTTTIVTPPIRGIGLE